MQLEEISVGWKTLAKILNLIRKAVNQNDPLQGEGISLSQTAGGTIISIEPKSSDNQPPNAAPVIGWLTFTWNGVGWQDITVVDPSTCATSTIKVLTKLDGTAITVPFYIDSSAIAQTAGTDTSKSVIYVMTGDPLQGGVVPK